MKLVTYEVDRRKDIGVVSKDEMWVFPLRAFGMEYKEMLEVVKGLSQSELDLLEHASGLDPYNNNILGAAMMKEVSLLAPISRPEQDIICLGINYMEHAEESARFKKEEFDGKRAEAVYFSKRVNESVGPYGDIQSHEDMVDSLDYEVELAVIIGKDARDVPADKARDYIFGYTIINDVSARNVQNKHKQWYFGKSLDGFTPMGPCILTADSVSYPPELRIQSKVNGELRQDSNTKLMIFHIDHIISELSKGMTLRAGTIISTGTPKGVGLGFEPPKFLKAGDEVECQIEGIGSIVNKVV
ncbi:fumarylacetoacetate hydrolase family protein [Clostridium sp. HBUAS56010]|uniref:fumarylacetoacetate hydrolase family protein n=1 Tax=Clostridium sp. HBUAS56010 TaxID=2571127 RepID=UPI00117789FF|nr:fumarylacetoacetate hydrolase family protein [Clostridium sp. HBUAS56010]